MTLPRVTVQTVLFHTDVERVERTLEAIDNSARWARADGRVTSVDVRIGDRSPAPSIDAARVARWRDAWPNLSGIDVVHLGEGLGHGAAQNHLAEATEAELLLLVDPYVIVNGDAIGLLVERLEDRTIGAVEAKQLPLEHPKDYDLRSGITSWVTGACCMIRTDLFAELGGFDAESFGMFCDDVDLSWRIRLRGLGVAIQPAALAFHDRRVGDRSGVLEPSPLERSQSVESALVLADKWSRPDVVAEILEWSAGHEDAEAAAGCAAYLRRREAGTLAERLDPENLTAEFVAREFAVHRYAL